MRNATATRMALMTAMAALLIALTPRPADAHHRPNLHCSKSGDLCQSTRPIDGRRKLGILLAAKYFKTFHLCVADPDGFESCVPFRVRTHDDGTFGRDVRWRRHFPYGGEGFYSVKWVVDGDRVGRKLGFHVE